MLQTSFILPLLIKDYVHPNKKYLKSTLRCFVAEAPEVLAFQVEASREQKILVVMFDSTWILLLLWSIYFFSMWGSIFGIAIFTFQKSISVKQLGQKNDSRYFLANIGIIL